MWEKLTALFKNQTKENLETEEDRLALQQQVQSLKLEILEREQIITRLNQQLEKQRSREENLSVDKARTQVESLMADASAPITQLLTLAHLSEVEGKALQDRDIILVAKRLVRVLENHGMVAGDKIGEVVTFEPDRHEPLAQEVRFKPGENVQIRFSSVTFQGKMLHKAGVSAVQEVSESEKR